MVWGGVVWGVMWCDGVWWGGCGVVWGGVVWGVMWCGVWCAVVGCGVVWGGV